MIIESAVAVAVPATRQNCGSPVFVVQPALPGAPPGGVLNVPPVTGHGRARPIPHGEKRSNKTHASTRTPMLGLNRFICRLVNLKRVRRQGLPRSVLLYEYAPLLGGTISA